MEDRIDWETEKKGIETERIKDKPWLTLSDGGESGNTQRKKITRTPVQRKVKTKEENEDPPGDPGNMEMNARQTSLSRLQGKRSFIGGTGDEQGGITEAEASAVGCGVKAGKRNVDNSSRQAKTRGYKISPGNREGLIPVKSKRLGKTEYNSV